MDAVRVEVIAQHTLWPAWEGVLSPVDQLPRKAWHVPVLEQTRVYVGFTRAGRARRDVAATLRHHPAWAWLDVSSARGAMAERRARGTSVLLLEAWVPLRRCGSLVYLGPAKHHCVADWYWSAEEAQLSGPDYVAIDINAPAPDVELRLHVRDKNRFLYSPLDARAWTAAKWSELWADEKPGKPRERAQPAELESGAANDTRSGGAGDLFAGAGA